MGRCYQIYFFSFFSPKYAIHRRIIIVILIGLRAETPTLFSESWPWLWTLGIGVIGVLMADLSKKPLWSLLGFTLVIFSVSEFVAQKLTLDNILDIWNTSIILVLEMTYIAISFPKIVKKPIYFAIVATISAIAILFVLQTYFGVSQGILRHYMYLILVAVVMFEWGVICSKEAKSYDSAIDAATGSFMNFSVLKKKGD